jgi:hypothetical protein
MIQNHLFSSSYNWEILPGLPVNLDILNFPSGERIFSEGLVLMVKPKRGKLWIGNFHGISNDYLSGIYTTPQIDKMCIVTGGKGFIINVNEPQKVTDVPVLPIIEVHPLVDFNIMVFVSFTDIAGFGLDNIQWKSRVSCDGIHITNISHGQINGSARDSAKGAEVEFSIKLETGELSGGACVK